MFNRTSVVLERGRGKRKANEKIENSEDRREKKERLACICVQCKQAERTDACKHSSNIDRKVELCFRYPEYISL